MDSLVKMGKSYCYSQVFLEECRYIVKEKQMIKFVNDELEISPDESDDSTEKNNA